MAVLLKCPAAGSVAEVAREVQLKPQNLGLDSRDGDKLSPWILTGEEKNINRNHLRLRLPAGHGAGEQDLVDPAPVHIQHFELPAIHAYTFSHFRQLAEAQ